MCAPRHDARETRLRTPNISIPLNLHLRMRMLACMHTMFVFTDPTALELAALHVAELDQQDEVEDDGM